MSDRQELLNFIGELTLETNVFSLILVYLIAREAKSAPDAEGWLRAFADEVVSSIDRGAEPPASILAKIEKSRAHIDKLMSAARLRLGIE